MKNILRAFSFFCLSLLWFAASSNNAMAQTEFTANLHFDATFNYAANVDNASVNYIISTNDGANLSLVREALINQEGVLSVNISPYSAATSQLSIVFKKPVDMDRLYDYFSKANIIYFYCPEGGFHIKDLKGWWADRLYK